MKTFTINGNHLTSLDDFYLKIEDLFLQNSTLKFGKNLDALNDILYGGFGSFEENENIEIVWQNFEKSKKLIKNIDLIEQIIKNHKNIFILFYP
ncbi:MAG: barstar family protein [Candidatus Gracilibacteria bacterium]|nr:barstar family protein [Candidatus Gracilibacteria bacterium]